MLNYCPKMSVFYLFCCIHNPFCYFSHAETAFNQIPGCVQVDQVQKPNVSAVLFIFPLAVQSSTICFRDSCGFDVFLETNKVKHLSPEHVLVITSNIPSTVSHKSSI